MAVRHVALVGATGTVGALIYKHLLSNSHFITVTVLTRPESESKIPADPKVKIARVNPDDHLDLVNTLTSVDSLIITLSVMAARDVQDRYIDAAVEAGVRYILPNGWGGDAANEEYAKWVPLSIPRKAVQKRIMDKARELGKPTKWIDAVHGPWFDYSLGKGSYGINIPDRTARFYDDGQAKSFCVVLDQVGLAVSRLLSLPEDAPAGSPSLSNYANNYVYFYSFDLSQRQMVDAVQTVTGTNDQDWTFKNVDKYKTIAAAFDELVKGNWKGTMDVMYGNAFVQERGSRFADKPIANDILGLPKLDLLEETRKVVEDVENGRWKVLRI